MAEYDSSEKMAVHCQQARAVWEHVPSYLAEQLEEIWAGRRKKCTRPLFRDDVSLRWHVRGASVTPTWRPRKTRPCVDGAHLGLCAYVCWALFRRGR